MFLPAVPLLIEHNEQKSSIHHISYEDHTLFSDSINEGVVVHVRYVVSPESINGFLVRFLEVESNAKESQKIFLIHKRSGSFWVSPKLLSEGVEFSATTFSIAPDPDRNSQSDGWIFERPLHERSELTRDPYRDRNDGLHDKVFNGIIVNKSLETKVAPFQLTINTGDKTWKELFKPSGIIQEPWVYVAQEVPLIVLQFGQLYHTMSNRSERLAEESARKERDRRLSKTPVGSALLLESEVIKLLGGKGKWKPDVSTASKAIDSYLKLNPEMKFVTSGTTESYFKAFEKRTGSNRIQLGYGSRFHRFILPASVEELIQSSLRSEKN